MVRRIDLTQLNDRRQFDVAMLDRVLPHEVCHLVLAEYFGDAWCPLPINEGLAMMAEAAPENDRILLASAVLTSNKKISLRELLAADRIKPDQAPAFYAESHSLISYLHHRLTAKQFRDLLANVKDGSHFSEALQQALFLPHDEKFLAKFSEAWQADAIRQGQFLRALDAGVADAK